MKLRIGCLDNTYWVEKKCLFRWRRLPTVRHYIDCDSIRYDIKYNAFFKSYEDAYNSARDYLVYFSKKAPVYSSIKK